MSVFLNWGRFILNETNVLSLQRSMCPLHRERPRAACFSPDCRGHWAPSWPGQASGCVWDLPAPPGSGTLAVCCVFSHCVCNLPPLPFRLSWAPSLLKPVPQLSGAPPRRPCSFREGVVAVCASVQFPLTGVYGLIYLLVSPWQSCLFFYPVRSFHFYSQSPKISSPFSATRIKGWAAALGVSIIYPLTPLCCPSREREGVGRPDCICVPTWFISPGSRWDAISKLLRTHLFLAWKNQGPHQLLRQAQLPHEPFFLSRLPILHIFVSAEVAAVHRCAAGMPAAASLESARRVSLLMKRLS